MPSSHLEDPSQLRRKMSTNVGILRLFWTRNSRSGIRRTSYLGRALSTNQVKRSINWAQSIASISELFQSRNSKWQGGGSRVHSSSKHFDLCHEEGGVRMWNSQHKWSTFYFNYKIEEGARMRTYANCPQLLQSNVTCLHSSGSTTFFLLLLPLPTLIQRSLRIRITFFSEIRSEGNTLSMQ